MKQTEILTHATHVNGWEPAVYMSCMSQHFRLFHVSNLSVRNFRIFLLMYTASVMAVVDSIAAVAKAGMFQLMKSTCRVRRCRPGQQNFPPGKLVSAPELLSRHSWWLAGPAFNAHRPLFNTTTAQNSQ